MDKKNILIAIMITMFVALLGIFFYNSQKQKDMYLQTMKNMEYNMNKGDGKANAKDPYKEIAVNNSLRKKIGDIQKCYNAFVATNPTKTDGFVEVDWIILPDGEVKKAELIASDLENKDLNSCLLGIIKNIAFPPPPTASETYMTHKYNFKKAAEGK